MTLDQLCPGMILSYKDQYNSGAMEILAIESDRIHYRLMVYPSKKWRSSEAVSDHIMLTWMNRNYLRIGLNKLP